MDTNHVKVQLLAGKPSYGAWLLLPSVESARVMARLGFDWLAVDMEHSPLGIHEMARMVAAIAETGTCAPLVRLPVHGVEWYKWALDAGAWGVIVPMINSSTEAREAVRWSRYPPQGQRSIGGVFGPYGFGLSQWSDYAAMANEQILVIVQIESAQALAHCNEILSVPGVDVAFVGPNDLHAQLGLPPRSESNEPVFVAALDTIVSASKQTRVPLGIFCSDGAAAARIHHGFQMVSITTDVALLTTGAHIQLRAAHAQ